MESKQYSIGEFAAMNKVTARMLRHYDKIGLMRPECVLPNGYRFYDESQIEQISQIKRLRGCGFLLDEIIGILQNNNQQFLQNEASRKLIELQTQAVQQQNAMQALTALIQENSKEEAQAIYGVTMHKQSEATLLVPHNMIDIVQAEKAFNALFTVLHEKNLPATGCAALLNYLDNQSSNQCLVAVPVAKPYAHKDYHTISTPCAPAISVIHYGDYYKIGHAYNALLGFARQNAYAINNVVMERYFIDSSNDATNNEYVTEVSVTLKNTP